VTPALVTYADLHDARIGPLSAAADTWHRLATRYTELEHATGTDLTGPLRASGWTGPAATAAFGRLDLLDDEFEVAALRARTAAIVLRRAVDDFTALQQRLQAATDGAVAAGLTIDAATGHVTPPPLSPAADMAAAEQAHQRNVHHAGIYTSLLAQLVADATDTDRRVARALTGLRDVAPGQNAWEYNQTGDAAKTAATALGLSETAIPAAGTSPAAVKAWWDGLSPDERQIYLTAWPDKVGGLDGLPAADRDTANQQALRNYLGDNVNQGRDQGNSQHDRAAYLLDQLEAAADDTTKAPLYLLTFNPAGDGQAAVAIGNPDTAAHTAVVVPGVGTELDEYHKELRRAQALHDETGRQTPGTSVSVIAWLGYDTPGGGGSGLDITTAPFGGKSEAGAAALDTFVDGLRTSHDGTPSHITGIGHSYGSTVYGEAASTGDGIAVDDIIVAGSPGMRVDHAGDLTTGTAHTWATAAADDNVVARPEHTTQQITPALLAFGPAALPAAVGLEPLVDAIHAPAPHDPKFGANVLHADSHGHSGYWDDTNVLKAQAAVVTGDYEKARYLGKAPGQ
jgi:hypothetical protein